MNINYNRLFNLNVDHDYFAGGTSNLVRLFPTAETEALLKSGQMLFKRTSYGVTVLYRATDDEVTPFVALDNDQRFVFALIADEIAELLNITDLDEAVDRTYSTHNILHFRNDPASASTNSNNPEIITHELIDTLRPQLFTYSFTLEGNPATALLRVTDADDNLVSVGKEVDGTPFPTTLTLTINSNDGFSQQIDLRDKAKGKYTLTVLNSGGDVTLKQEEIYADDLLSAQNILGLVEIVYDTPNGHLYSDTEEYMLQFQRADTFWKYYVVNKSSIVDFDTDSLSVNDSGTPNGTPYVTNQFPRVYAGIQLTADSTGTSGNSIALGYSGGGEHPAVMLSGETLAGGADSVAAQGKITLINNEVTGYTVSIDGVDFTEGTHFSQGSTPNETADALITAINDNGSVSVSAALLNYDIMINDLPSLVFSSSQRIPFFEKPKLDIQLRKTSDDQAIISNLPNPSHRGIRKLFAGNPESEIYVFI